MSSTPFGDVVTPGSGSVSSDSAPATGGTNEQTAPRDFSDNDIVRTPSGETVKYGDLYKRLQSDYTKKNQDLATSRKQWESERTSWQSQREQTEAQLKALATELLKQRGQATQPQGKSFIDQLEQREFLDGKTAAQLFREIQEGGFGAIQTAINERDQVIKALYGQLQNVSKQVQGLQGTYRSSAFDGLIDRTMSSLGMAPELKDFAKEVYLAYEGDDLDQEFPQILQRRWEQLQGHFKASQNAQVAARKNQAFPFAGKGGQGAAGKPIGLKGNENPRDTADKLWDMIHSGGDNT